MALLDDDGHPVLGEAGDDVVRRSIRERTRRSAETTLELEQRRLDSVDLIVQGATLRQVAKRHGLTLEEAREDYRAGVEFLNDRSVDRVRDMREEITARQRVLIMANMSQARAGDIKAALVVQRADETLISIWGLRYIQPPADELPSDPTIAGALDVYLAAVSERLGISS